MAEPAKTRTAEPVRLETHPMFHQAKETTAVMANLLALLGSAEAVEEPAQSEPMETTLATSAEMVEQAQRPALLEHQSLELVVEAAVLMVVWLVAHQLVEPVAVGPEAGIPMEPLAE